MESFSFKVGTVFGVVIRGKAIRTTKEKKKKNKQKEKKKIATGRYV